MSFVPDLRTVLREPHFERLFATRLVSQAADGVFQVALASYVFFSPERQTTAGRAAAAFATLLLPYCLVGPFAGVLIDRWRRQRILVLANRVRALMVLGVAVLVAGGYDGPAFFAAALAVLSVNRFFLSALSAALPHVVPTRLLVMGNSVSTTSGTLLAVVGGGLGFGVRELTSSNVAVLMTAAAGYLTSSLLAGRMAEDLLGPDHDPRRPAGRAAARAVLLGVADGARHVWEHRPAGHALAAIAAHRFFYGLSTISTLLLYRNYFGDADDPDGALGGLALVFAASALGYLIAALITPGAARRWGERSWVVALFAAAALVELVFGLPYTEPAVVVAALLLGVVAQGSKICVDTIVQRRVDDAFRGRVFSFYDIVFNVSFVAAAVFAALTLPPSGKSYVVLLFIAAGYALTALLYGLVREPADAVSSGPARPPTPAAQLPPHSAPAGHARGAAP